MKRLLLLSIALLGLVSMTMAGSKKKATTGKAVVDTTAIQWLTIDEMQKRMAKEPRKVYMDVYTDWCGWCKVMDKKTFSNKEVIKYMNTHFYAVKLNAESQDSFKYNGRNYGYMPDYKANVLAVELMQGKMSYPTSIIIQEQFQNPQPIPGYLDVPTMEKVLKFFGDGVYKVKSFDDYQKEFVATWQPAQG